MKIRIIALVCLSMFFVAGLALAGDRGTYTRPDSTALKAESAKMFVKTNSWAEGSGDTVSVMVGNQYDVYKKFGDVAAGDGGNLNLFGGTMVVGDGAGYKGVWSASDNYIESGFVISKPTVGCGGYCQ